MGHRALRRAVLGWWLLAPPAQAAATPRLSLQVNVCPGVDLEASEVERSLRAELDADGLVHVSDANADATLLASVGCDAVLSTSIRLTVARTGRHSERSIVLGDASPSARAGVLALAAAELVRSDGPLLAAAEPSKVQYPNETSPGSAPAGVPAAPLAPPPAPTPPTLRASTPGPVSDRSRASQPQAWSLSANARLRWFVDYASVSWGGDAGANFGAWRLRAEALLSSPHDALGSASLGSAAVSVGYRVLETRLGLLRVASYPTAALGATWMRGAATDAGVHVTPATGVYADLRLVTEARLQTAALSPTLALELGRASGYVARSAERALGATGGFFVGGSLGGAY